MLYKIAFCKVSYIFPFIIYVNFIEIKAFHIITHSGNYCKYLQNDVDTIYQNLILMKYLKQLTNETSIDISLAGYENKN